MVKCKNCEEEATLIYQGIKTCRECLYDYWDENFSEDAFQDFVDEETKEINSKK